MTDPAIRLSRPDDLEYLGDVEASAAKAFEVLPDFVPMGGNLPHIKLVEMQTNDLLWVAVDENDRPIGFLGASEKDDGLYIEEVSVALDRQQRGIGGKLLKALFNRAKDDGYKTISLTTRRDAPWNMRHYQKYGFAEMTDKQRFPQLLATLQAEIDGGADPAIRCAMVKMIDILTAFPRRS